MEKNEIAKEIIDLSRSALMMELRFMDAALFELTPIPLPGSGIMTDGQFLYYDEDHIIRSFAEEKSSVARALLHSVLHCVFSHSFTGEGIDRELWSLSCDIAVENMINEARLSCAASGLSDRQTEITDRLKGRLKAITAERVYAFLKKSEDDKLDALKPLFFRDRHDKWFARRPDPMHRGTGTGKNVKNDYRHTNTSSASDKPAQTKNTIVGRWKKLAEGIQVELDKRASEWGDRSGSMTQALNALHREKYSYAEFLKKFSVLGEVIKTDDDSFDYIFYTYGLQLYDNMPLIEPLEYKEVKRIKDFVIAIDTSGSVQGELVRKFVEKTYNILMEKESFFNKINLHIIQCDTEIKEDALITCREDFDKYISSMQLHGFSGTDFRPVFIYVNELIEQKQFSDLRGLIYFTDGLGTFPTSKPPYDTAFVFADSPELSVNVPPWAIRLVLDEADI